MIALAKSLAVRVLLALLVLAALTLGLGRLLAPQVADFRSEIEQWASRALGQPLRIAALQAGWRGATPQLVLKDVALLSAEDGNPALTLSEVRVELSLFDSLRSARLQLKELTLSGVDILVKRRSDGSVVAAGLEQLSTAQGDASALFLIPARISLSDSDIYWQNLAIGAAPIHFSNVEALLSNDGRRHRFSLKFDPPGGDGGRVELAANIRGDLDSPAGWSGELYIKGQHLALAELLKYRIPSGYQFRAGWANLELWSDWEDGEMRWLGGSAGLQQLELVQLSEDDYVANKIVQIDRLGADMRWQYRADGWELDLQDIVFERMGLDWPASRFSIATRFDPEGKLHVRSGADFLRVEDIGAIMRMFPLPDPDLQQALASIRPHSDLHDLRFRYDAGEQGARWSARGTASSLYTKHWRRIPGVNNLSTRFWADQDQGTLQLQGENTRLRFPGLFRDPLTLAHLDGLLRWRRQPDGGWLIDTQDLRAGNQDLETRSRLRMTFPSAAHEPVFMDLQTDFRDGDARTTSRYLPVGIMSDEVVKWLDHSIHSGRVVEGSCIVRGPLRDFPFHETSSGRFEVFFKVDDLILDYWPGWPALTRVNADVRFLDNGFDTWIDSGRMYQTRIREAHARIRDLSQPTPLELSARADGPLRNLLRLLRESPLSADFGQGVRHLQAGGRFRLNLDLGIPIADDGNPRVKGRVGFLDSTLDLVDWQLPISSLRGDLLFDQNGVEAQQIQALIFGNTVSVDIQRPVKDRPSTRILAAAALPIHSLVEQFPKLALDGLRGTSEWLLQLDIPNLSAPPGTAHLIEVRSDLIGTAIDHPPPLGKSAVEKRNLVISAAFGDSASQILRIAYSPLVDTALRLDSTAKAGTKIVAGDIRLGAGKAELPTKGLEIRARLEALDLDHWLGVVTAQKVGNDTNAPLIHRLQVNIDRLKTDYFDLDQFSLDLTRSQQTLSGQLSSNRFAGRLSIPYDFAQAPLLVQLNRLDLAFDTDQPQGEKPAQHPAGPRPDQLPEISLDITQLRVNDHDMGRLQLETGRTPQGMQIKRLSLDGGQTIEAEVTGDWVLDSQGAEHSSFDLSLKSDDLGQLLTELGYARSVDKAPMEVEGQLSWSAKPWQVDTANLDAQLNLRLEEGRLLQVDPGLGGRAFTLLTIDDNLWRRLTLDFSNLFEKGFSFDKVRADVQVAAGKAHTDNLKIKGPAARIDVAGWIDLVEETLDEQVTVTPRLSSTLPIAGALIVNPAVGAVLLLAQQLVGDKVDKVSRVRYQVTGPWADPQVKTIERSELKATPAPPQDDEAKSSEQLLFPAGD